MSNQAFVVTGELVEEVEFSLADLSRSCQVNADWLITLVNEGIIEPIEINARWRFAGHSVQRVRKVQRLQRDLGVNLAGAALALELLTEMAALRARLAALESDDNG